jgi:hypothetical protein
LLFRWLDFADDSGMSLRAWVAKIMEDDHHLARLVRAFTSASYQQGMGFMGLGDRVPRKVVRAQVQSLDKILDLQGFRARVDELAQFPSTLSEPEKADIVAFRTAWIRQERGSDDD